MNLLPPFEGPHLVELIDGKMVFNDSEEYRHEMEARSCAAMPYAERAAHFAAVEKARGPAAADRLRKTVDEVIAVTAARTR